MSDLIVPALALIGVIQAILVCLVSFSRLSKGRHYFYLGLIFLGLTLRVGKSFFNNYLEISAFSKNIGISGLLLVGPALFYYLKSVTTERVESTAGKNKAGAFFYQMLPFLLFLVASPFLPNGTGDFANLPYVIILSHLTLYCVLTLSVYQKSKTYLTSALRNFSFMLIAGISLLCSFYWAIFSGLISYYLGGALLYSALLALLTYILLVHATVLDAKITAKKFSLSESRQLCDKICAYLIDNQLFLEPKLSIEDVAQAMNINQRELSHAINENEHKSFSTLLNDLRVNYAEDILRSQPTAKILAVAISSGFSNLASFNREFKKRKAVPAGLYREKISHRPR
jgi:AraC-like DNA-binding protein